MVKICAKKNKRYKRSLFLFKNLQEGIVKKQFLKTALITMAVVGVLSGSALAAPMLDGGFSMTGSWSPVGIDGVTLATIPAATGIDFGGYISSAADNTFQVTTATFDFQGLVGNIGTINNFQFDVPSTPVSPLWSTGGYSFLMTSLTYQKTAVGNSNYLEVFGTGLLSAAGFEDTPGIWNFTGQGANNANFSWSASVDASPVPEPATMLLFGSGMLGLAFIGRRIRA